MEYRLTPRQLALATGVSESSIKRWCDAGKIATVRTPGGHRRIPLSGAMQFLRGSEYQLEKPEVLGLPAVTHRGVLRLSQASVELAVALQAGAADVCRQILFELYLDRHPMSEIGDQVIAPAFHRIGHRWESGELEVFEERRASEITRNLLHELRLSQQPSPPGAPVAVGGARSGDDYAIAPILVELVLREAGWRACYLGSNLPIDTLINAIRDQQPQIFWLSVSHLPDEEAFHVDYQRLVEAARSRTVIVLGGRALHAELLARLDRPNYCETLHMLGEFARERFPEK